MKCDSEKHLRRSIRLTGYDYSRCGAYFITICTQKRLCLFGDIVNGIMAFNDAGRMIERTFVEMSAKYTGVQTDVFVVMPNHLHGIIKIEDEMSKNCEYIENNPCKWDEDEENPYKIGNSQQLAPPNANLGIR